MRIRWMQLATPVAAALTASALTIGVTQAHVTVWPRESAANASELYTVRVPTEKDIPTVGVRVDFPAEVTVSRFVPAPGWQREVTRDSSGKIISVSWSGGSIAPDEVGLFSFQARNPQTGEGVSFKAIQRYADGSTVEWVGPADDARPASVVKLTEPAMSPAGLTTAASIGQVIAAINLLDTSGFHDLDESAAAGTIPAGSLGRVQRAHYVAAATKWPAALADQAKSLTTELGELRAALEADNVAEAAGPAHEVHEMAHDLSSGAYAWLAKQGGVVEAEPAHTGSAGQAAR
jgi:uncharacterized protein YcnI